MAKIFWSYNIPSDGKDMDKLILSYIADGKQFGSFLETKTYTYHITQQSYS